MAEIGIQLKYHLTFSLVFLRNEDAQLGLSALRCPGFQGVWVLSPYMDTILPN